MPLFDGSYDPEHVLREPVVAWRINGGDYAEPVRVGNPVTDRWAVLTPEGLVIGDEYSNLLGEAPLSLKDWIKSEIEWLKSDGRFEMKEWLESAGVFEPEDQTLLAQKKH